MLVSKRDQWFNIAMQCVNTYHMSCNGVNHDTVGEVYRC